MKYHEKLRFLNKLYFNEIFSLNFISNFYISGTKNKFLLRIFFDYFGKRFSHMLHMLLSKVTKVTSQK